MDVIDWLICSRIVCIIPSVCLRGIKAMTLSQAERDALNLIYDRPSFPNQLPHAARNAVPALTAHGLISTKGKCLNVTDSGEAWLKAASKITTSM